MQWNQTHVQVNYEKWINEYDKNLKMYFVDKRINNKFAYLMKNLWEKFGLP